MNEAYGTRKDTFLNQMILKSVRSIQALIRYFFFFFHNKIWLCFRSNSSFWMPKDCNLPKRQHSSWEKNALFDSQWKWMILILAWSVKHCTNKNSEACWCAIPYLYNACDFVYLSFCMFDLAEEKPLSSCFFTEQVVSTHSCWTDSQFNLRWWDTAFFLNKEEQEEEEK